MNIADLNIEEDYERLYYLMARDAILEVNLRGFKRIISDAVEKLGQKPVKTMIAIPLKTGQDLLYLSQTLRKLERQTETGVIFGLDNVAYVDGNWLELLRKLKCELEQKYTFLDRFFTTVIPLRELKKKFLQFGQMLDKASTIMQSVGVKDPYNALSIGFIREEMRLVLKQMNPDNIFWLDADLVIPNDIITRLQGLLNKADIACGWYNDRHLPDGHTSVMVGRPFWTETERDKAMQKSYHELFSKAERLIKLQFDGCSIRPGPMSIPYWHMEDLAEPFEIDYTGFGCVLCSKKVNDSVSFIDHVMRLDAVSEDFDFCKDARRAGFKILVDPTCKCDHH